MTEELCRAKFEKEAAQSLRLPEFLIKQARIGTTYDFAFDSMSVMQPLSAWWKWYQIGWNTRAEMEKSDE